MDPSYKEELLMRGRLTVILNVHGDICAIQKGGGVGVTPSDILRCLQIASTKVADVTLSLKKAVEAHELERAERKIKRHHKLCGVEHVTLLEDVEVSKDVQARCVMHEKDDIANSLSSSDIDSSSVGSFDDSASEEEKVSTGFSSGKVVKQEVRRAMGQPRLPQYAGESLVFPLQKDVDETSSGTSTRLHAERFGEIQGSIVGQGDQMTSVSEVVGSLVSRKFESIVIQASEEVGSIGSGASSSLEGKPRSLLDAVKWNNVKKKRAV